MVGDFQNRSCLHDSVTPGTHVTTDTARSRFAEIVLPHLDDAYTLARWMTGSAPDAEDVVQDACVRALRALDTTVVEQPRAWLLTIVRNTALTWMAKNRSRNVVSAGEEEGGSSDSAPQVDSAPSPEEAVIARADHDSVRAAIAALPDAFREAIVMREINGLSYREIAEAAGIPIGTVMSRLARARLMLMHALGRPA
jgi:RNA polymerase sigma factor (sigma-70 family)